MLVSALRRGGFTMASKTLCNSARLSPPPSPRWSSGVFSPVPAQTAAGDRVVVARFKSNDRHDSVSAEAIARSAAPSQADVQSRREENHVDIEPAPLGWGVALIPAALGAAFATGGLASFWNGYMDMLVTQPLLTKVLTGVTGAFMGDLLAQSAPHMAATAKSVFGRNNDAGAYTLRRPKQQPFQYNALRALRMVGYSAVIGTPAAHFWYLFLDASISPANPTAPSAIITKTLLDQLLFSPFFTAFFFVAMSVLEGHSINKAINGLKEKFIPTMKANYMLWPAAHIVNFAFIPGDQRILYINCVALLWNIFLSTVANKAPPPPAVNSPAPAAHYQAGVEQEVVEEQAMSAAAMQAIPITLQADAKKLS